MTRDWGKAADEPGSLWAEGGQHFCPEIGFGGHSRRDGIAAFWICIHCMIRGLRLNADRG